MVTFNVTLNERDEEVFLEVLEEAAEEGKLQFPFSVTRVNELGFYES